MSDREKELGAESDAISLRDALWCKALICCGDLDLILRNVSKFKELRDIEERLRAQLEVKKVGYWWCPQCRQECLWHMVTYEEYHELCGTRVIWKKNVIRGAPDKAEENLEDLDCDTCGAKHDDEGFKVWLCHECFHRKPEPLKPEKRDCHEVDPKKCNCKTLGGLHESTCPALGRDPELPASEGGKREHVLWKRGDKGVPTCVLDGNGDVVLGMCKVCGKAEVELSESCVPLTTEAKLRRWFSYDGNNFETHDTEDAARKSAEDSLTSYRDEAYVGWSDEVDQVCWGHVIQEAEVTLRRPREAEAHISGGCDDYVDYELMPKLCDKELETDGLPEDDKPEDVSDAAEILRPFCGAHAEGLARDVLALLKPLLRRNITVNAYQTDDAAVEKLTALFGSEAFATWGPSEQAHHALSKLRKLGWGPNADLAARIVELNPDIPAAVADAERRGFREGIETAAREISRTIIRIRCEKREVFDSEVVDAVRALKMEGTKGETK